MPEKEITLSSEWFRHLRHDLCGKLNGILGFGQLLQDSSLSEEQRHHVNKIVTSGEGLLTLIERLAEVSAETPSSAIREDTSTLIDPTLPEQVQGKTVLIIDDEVVNLELLVKSLSKGGFNLRIAKNRIEALQSIREQRPDVILLDVRMPDVSGYELCREMQSFDSLSETPIIFLSGASDIQSRLRAYEAGGVDFIVKPFYSSEVMVRVGTHVALVNAKERLKRYAESLEQLIKERTDQLLQQDRMASLGLMSAGIVHEINNPVTFIKGNLAVLRKFEKDLMPLLRDASHSSPESNKLTFIAREFPKLLTEMEMGAERIRAIVQGLKFFARQESAEKTNVDIVEVIENSLQLAKGELKRFEIRRDWPSGLPYIKGNAQQLSQVLVNLFVNASHAMRDLPHGMLTVQVRQEVGHHLSLKVIDNGCGIEQETLKKIWMPFFTTKQRDVGTGLGLSIVHGIIEDHKGTISVESQPGSGACFTIRLPDLTQDLKAAA